jgi:ABC-type antimicrobial peptide transport system permease subunit
VLSLSSSLRVLVFALGLVVSIFASRLLQSSLYHVSRFDYQTLVAVPVLLVSIALFAAYWPARRATKVDPMVALRYE